ncbi:Acyl-CoA synthetase (AMP-forming)/AMP-acid ligase II [Roseovarius pacificus]|uniref:Acyl-CoA synthetase (AMP-forming)/AMP-acid ligase II n=1 Tax=Roseovarius pacificus TaxID=337701 RepID=A0A1M7BB22_9RHOB|nr:AMP-binding protein [Roseovarius pacificus]GGO54868.1 putative long-chain-fatty-acid CoA ligase [Roseovarius pacificus]SHL52127.1 Acyl-CoA synthetase (AMP-forming)/AMP-acid ligase II [Roseovarius pacificus]
MTTFGELVRRNGRHWAEKDAYVATDRKVTWKELDRRTDALGHAYRALGLIPGDRVGVLTHDSVEIPETFLAAAKVGGIRVGINTRLAAAEIAALIKDSTPRILVYGGEYQDLMDLVSAQLSDMADPPLLVGIGGLHKAKHDYEDLIARHMGDGELEHTPHELSMIAYTSGSTGLPKGAVYPHDKFLQAVVYVSLYEGLTHDSVWLHTMPAAGVPMMHMLRNVFLAAKTVIVGPWNPEQTLSLIEQHSVTETMMVPTMLAALLNEPNLHKYDVKSLKLLGYGAAPLPPSTIRQAMQTFNCNFIQMYGCTEILGMSHMLLPSDHITGLNERPEILASAGRPLSWVDVRIIDEDNRDVPTGELGEVVIRSDIAFPGYWNNPEQSKELFVGDYLRLGDLGRVDDFGYLYLSDRVKFRMKSGGYNVYPTEIENVLADHEAVSEVCVFGVPDSRWGDRIEAVVTLREGAECSGDALKDFCRNKIANFKIPKNIEIWDDLPRGATGKILKRSVIDLMVERYAKLEASE